MQREVKLFSPELKAAGPDGTASFVIATLEVVDSDGDVTMRGFFGRQHVSVLPAHDWGSVPLGKGVVHEDGKEAVAEVKFNLDIEAARDWHSAIVFDLEHPPSLQEYSYGFTILDGGSSPGTWGGEKVRVLHPLANGRPGVKVHEVSPVLVGAGVGTRTLAAKSLTFVDNLAQVLGAVEQAVDRAEKVSAMRGEKGRQLNATVADHLDRIQGALKRLEALGTKDALDAEYERYLRLVERFDLPSL